MKSLSYLTLFLLLVLAVVSHASNLTDESRLQPRWVYTYDPTDDFYDDDPDEGYVKPASSHINPHQPVQPVIVAKVTPAPKKVPAAAAPAAAAYSPPPSPPQRSPYDTPPGSFSPQSYGGPSNYASGKKYGGPIDLYSSYLSSSNHQAWNQYCNKGYAQKPQITTKDLDNAFAYAWNEVQGYIKNEVNVGQHGGYMNVSTTPYSSTARHQIATYLSRLSLKSFKEKEALIMEYASKFLNKYKCLSKFDTHFLLPTVRIKDRPLKDYQCNHAFSPGAGQRSVNCTAVAKSPYRTPNGVCNNLFHPYWGKAGVCHLRLMASAYEDGISSPKVNSFKYGYKLPPARRLSNLIHYDKPDRFFYTAAVMTFGQFVQHDISFTPSTKPESKGTILDCCKKPPAGYKGAPGKLHPQCLPIELEANDYQAKNYGKTCLSFVRSAPCPLCSLGPREHLNTVTSFLDLSVTYGSSQEEQNKLRLFKGGLLKFTKNKYGNVLLPRSTEEEQCSSKSSSHYCFVAGDVRGNQHPMLQSYHVIFLRNHNRIAENLAKLNPSWSDEKLFQEARRINNAEYQHIIYEEWLPLLFGPTLVSYYNLNADGYESYSRYDYKSKSQHYRKNLYSLYEPATDPTTWNEYTTAACRYGHSQVLSFYSLIGGSGYNGQNYTSPAAYPGKAQGFWLRDVFFSSSHMHEGQMDAVIKGMISDHSMLVDPHASEEVRNYLYKAPNERVGSDLISINIQRQRDHAFPGYISYIQFCFGEKITKWEDLKKYIPDENIARLRSVYPDVRDIDLYVGGLNEKKFPDASVGPTFACIIGIQLYGLKFGDRYFYSHGYQAGSFTPDQLLNIKEVSSFAHLLCKNADNIKSIQLNPFLPASRQNYEIPCSSLPDINFNLFKS